MGEHLKSLSLTVTSLLYRLPHEVELLDVPCYRCGKHLSDIDGLPLTASGWIPPTPHRSGSDKVANGKADEGMDVDDEDKEGKGEKEEKDAAEAKAPVEGNDGRWVAWHASCRAP